MRREPTVTFTSVSPASLSSRSRVSSPKPSCRSPSLSRTQVFAVRTQIEHEHFATRPHDPGGLGHGVRRLRRVVQRLGQQPDVHRRRLERQAIDVTALERNVGRPPPPGQRLGARQHRWRSIHRHDAARPARDLDGQIALAAPDVHDVDRWQKVAEGPRPCGPAPARHQLPTVARVGAGMLVEILSTHPQHLLQSRIVGSQPGGVVGGRELRLQQGPQGTRVAVADGRRQPVVAERAVTLLADQPGFLQQSEMPGDAGLRQAENAGQLGDVEAIPRQDAQQAEPRLVAQQAEERRGLLHIYKCRLIDVIKQVVDPGHRAQGSGHRAGHRAQGAGRRAMRGHRVAKGGGCV